MSDLKIFATSDLHGHLQEFIAAVDKENPDIVVVAGDLTDKSRFRPKEALSVWRYFLALCAAWPEIEFVVVMGNHDLSLWLTHQFAGETGPNVHVLAGYHRARSVSVKGLVFAGSMVTNGIVPQADVLVYHYNPFDLGDRNLSNKLHGTPVRRVLYGHEHALCNEVEQREGVPVTNVSSLVSEGGRYTYQTFVLSPQEQACPQCGGPDRRAVRFVSRDSL